MIIKIKMPQILRFNLSPEINQLLNGFNEKNKHLENKEYKEEWLKFVKDNTQSINIEERRLVNIGFNGDINKKLFTSVKYYLKTKTTNEPKERRQYVHIEKKVLQMIDEHIEKNINEKTYTPAKGFTNFCENYESHLKIEKDRLRTQSDLSVDDIGQKIKKTYKNRYFILSR